MFDRWNIQLLQLKRTLSEDYQDAIDCAVCRQKTKFPGGVVTKLPKNMTIISLLEKCGKKKFTLTQKRIQTLLTDVSVLA